MYKYNSIDILKFIASFFVVMIHVSMFSDVNPYLNLFITHGVARLAVPLYFLTSAFFFYKNNMNLTGEEQKNSLLKYTKRMAILYVSWFVISLPMTVYNRFIYNGKPFLENLFLFIKSFFLTSTFSGSWFLVACIFSVWVLYFVLNKSFKDQNQVNWLIIGICCFVYLICVICSAYGKIFSIFGLENLYKKIVYLTAKPYNSIIVGLPYFVIGRYFAQKDIHLTKFSKLLVILCFVLLFIEIFLTYKFELKIASDCYFMLLPCASFIFVFIKNINVELKFKPVILRKTSTIIFFSHFIFIFTIEIFERFLNVNVNPLLRFPIVCCLSLILAFVLIKLTKFEKFNFIKHLY
ncbi:MAG: acyltransferase [Clostridia bacterium]|nr:acyltransferase [Clostridia bacterium]